ncbi:MAG TPA: cytochrome c peroxidase [Stellaceae bacterium]|nr:cytochrome c peroxidase [Stellaceae bacterium]
MNDATRDNRRKMWTRLRWGLQLGLVVLLLSARAYGPNFSAFAGAEPAPAAERAEWKADDKRPPEIPFPANDPYTDAKAALGKMLFFDPILSGSGTQSCSSCHQPNLGWTDGQKVGIGVAPMTKHTPTLLNIAWIPVLGWDGHFPSLEKVAFGPITAPGIMNRPESELIAALQARPPYAQAFAAAFPDHAVTRSHIEDALATFERTIVSGEAPFDRWIAGDEDAISPEAKRGFDVFNGKAGCAECHSGWNFTDAGFYDIGVGKGDDVGRALVVPNSPKLKYAFKVPSLRDVAQRAPYMHDGSEPTLEAVIDLYNRGGIDRPSRSELIKPLNLTEREKADLVAFLKTLSQEPERTAAIPTLPR